MSKGVYRRSPIAFTIISEMPKKSMVKFGNRAVCSILVQTTTLPVKEKGGLPPHSLVVTQRRRQIPGNHRGFGDLLTMRANIAIAFTIAQNGIHDVILKL